MLNCSWFEQVLRNAQPVVIMITCFCLCLGSGFPSSDPLNRIPSSREEQPMADTTEMAHLKRTVHRTSSSPVDQGQHRAAGPSSPENVFTYSSANSDADSYVRSMDRVSRQRLQSSGQLSTNSNSSTGPSGPINSANSTNNGSTVNATSTDVLTGNSLPCRPRKNRHRHGQDAISAAAMSAPGGHKQRHKMKKHKKRERLSRLNEDPNTSLTERGGKKGKRNRSETRRGPGGGLESRTIARTNSRDSGVDASTSTAACKIFRRSWRNVRQLINLSNRMLAVHSNGSVYAAAAEDTDNTDTFLILISHRRSIVRIFAVAANKFVCMDNRTGVVYAADEWSTRDCTFFENSSISRWTSSFALANSPGARWYLGLEKNTGQVKNGRRVREHQRIANFMAGSPPWPGDTCSGGPPRERASRATGR